MLSEKRQEVTEVGRYRALEEREMTDLVTTGFTD